MYSHAEDVQHIGAGNLVLAVPHFAPARLCQKVRAAGAGWLEEVQAFAEDSSSASEFNISAVHI